jgi:hypothetical protein
MGGFSASYVLRSSAAAADVERELRHSLCSQGFTETDESLSDEDMWGAGGVRRGIIICEPVGGWVPVIDSAAMVVDTPEFLSKVFATSALNAHVHDSDFWCYSFYQHGTLRDSFSSINQLEYFGTDMGDFEGLDEMESAELATGSDLSLDERWDLFYTLLKDGVTRDEFDRVLTPVGDPSDFSEWIMGEEGLSRFFNLLGIDATLAYLSYRYWLEDPAAHSLKPHCHLRFDSP